VILVIVPERLLRFESEGQDTRDGFGDRAEFGRMNSAWRSSRIFLFVQSSGGWIPRWIFHRAMPPRGTGSLFCKWLRLLGNHCRLCGWSQKL